MKNHLQIMQNFLEDPEYKKSVINGKKVELFRVDATKTINKAMYQNAIFEYNDVHFVVETKNITEEEFFNICKKAYSKLI